MGPEDPILIACNEFCGVGAIVLRNEKRNERGRAEAQNRLIDHTELNFQSRNEVSSLRPAPWVSFLTLTCSWSRGGRTETEAEGGGKKKWQAKTENVHLEVKII